MSMAKIAISIEIDILEKLDALVRDKVFKNRSQAFQISMSDTLQHLTHDRLAQECEKLDIHFEQEMADLGLEEDLAAWPKY